MDTASPGFIFVARRTISQLARRIQPWLAERPIESGSLVPWMPIPFLLSAIQITPTGLFGPGGSRWKLPLRLPCWSISLSQRKVGIFVILLTFHSPMGDVVCAEPMVTGYAAISLSPSRTSSILVLLSIFTATGGAAGSVVLDSLFLLPVFPFCCSG